MDSRTMLRIVLFLWRMDYDTILNIVFFLFFTSGTVSARLPESPAEAPSPLLFETHTESGSVITTWIADHVPVIVGLALALALAVAVFHTCCRKAGPPTRIAENFSDSNLVGKESNPRPLVTYSERDLAVATNEYSNANLVGKESNPGSLVTYSERDLAVATNEYSNANLVGQGQFASVYRAHLEGKGIVAVKRLLKIDYTRFRTELSILLMLPHHRNLVNLLGMCSEPDNQMIVFEYVANGTLFSHLHENQGVAGPLSWASRKKIARQIAEALKHLHEEVKPPIIHRDVKSKNVLLENDFSAKLADFGIAKLGPKNNQSTRTTPCGTPGYIDPQYYVDGRCSAKSDVYSFGVLLLELITGTKAVNGDENLVNRTHKYRLNTSTIMTIVDQSLADSNNESELLKMIGIANKCLESNRYDRPSMAEVVNMIG